MTERVERVIAWFVALAVNALIIGYLAMILHAGWLESPTREQATEVFFIKQTAPLLKTAALNKLSQPIPLPPQARTAHPLQQRELVPQRVETKAGLRVIRATTAINTTEANDWSFEYRMPTAPAPDFKPNPLAHRAEPMLATVPKTKFRMFDSSIGGRLAAMVKAQMCRELRQSLTTSPTSANAILASMEQNGCNRKD